MSNRVERDGVREERGTRVGSNQSVLRVRPRDSEAENHRDESGGQGENEQADGSQAEGSQAAGSQVKGGIFQCEPSTGILLPMLLLFNIQSMLVFVLLPGIQARWFTKCERDHPLAMLLNETNIDGKCKPDYEAAQAVNGVIDSVRNLFSFVTAAFIGRISDVVGRKPCLIAYLCISTLPTMALFMTEGESAPIYYGTCIACGMVGSGAGSGFWGFVLNSYLGDSYPASERSVQFGRIAAVGSIGMIVQPWLARFTDKMNLTEVCMTSLIISAVVIVYMALVVPESLPSEKRNKFSWGRTLNPLAPLRLLSQSRLLRWVALVALLGDAAQSGCRTIGLIYTDQVLGLEGAAARDYNRILFAVIGAFFLVNNAVILPALYKLRVRPSAMISFGQVGNAVHILFYIFLAYYPFKWVSLLNAVPTGFTALSSVSMTWIISANMGAQEQGFALGTLSAVAGLADIVSPLVYSEMFAYFGHRFSMPQAPFILGFLCAVAAACVPMLRPFRELELKKRRVLSTSHSVAYSPDTRLGPTDSGIMDESPSALTDRLLEDSEGLDQTAQDLASV